jgi:TolB protein
VRVAAQSQAPIIVQDPSASSYRAAIQRFALGGGTVEAMQTELHTAIERSLTFSGLFANIDPRAFLDSRQSARLADQAAVVCPNWKQIGADALLQGEINGAEGRVRVEFRLLDVQRGCLRMLRKRYTGTPEELRRIGLAIGDDIVAAFTGKPGVSDTEVAFVSTRSGQKEVFVMDADGGGLRAVTQNGSINSFPSWSPAGDAIVYTSYRHRNRPRVFLLTRGRKSPGRILRDVPNKGPIYRAVFHPEGARVAFAMSIAGTSEIFAAGLAGADAKQLTRNAVIDVAPSWSPDGKRIAFVSDRTGAPQVYIMDADGGGQRRLTYNGSYNTHPAWSPDGQWIAYESRVRNQFDIWLIDPEGSTNYPLVDHPRSDEYPAWSPDGRKLAFSSTRRGTADIYVVDVSGKNLIRLTDGKAENTNPAWGPYRR